MVLLQQKATRRNMNEKDFWARLHNRKIKKPGLDFSGAVAIEELVGRGVPGFGGGPHERG